LAILRAAGQALEFLGFIVLARRLGAQDFGTLTVAFLVCRYAGLIADWGATLKGTRDVAAGYRHDDVHALVRRREVVSVVLGIAYVLAVVAVGLPGLIPLVACIAGRGLNRDWLALGREEGTRAGVTSIAQGLLLAVGVVFVGSLFGAALVIGIAYGSAALLSVLLNRLEHRTSATQPAVEGWLLLATLSDQVFQTSDTLLLALLVGASSAGIYSAVYRAPNAWMTVVGLVITGYLPVVTRRLRSDPEQLRTARRRALKCGGAMALLVVASIPIAYVLVPVVLGEGYASGRAPMCILLAAAAVMTCTAGLAPIYYATRPDRLIAWWMTAAAVTNVSANLVLIPHFGMNGAASVTLGTQLMLSSFLLLQTRASRTSTNQREEAERPLVARFGPPEQRREAEQSSMTGRGLEAAVDVVILTWNDGELLDVAVDSALAQHGVQASVTVVDNGSDPRADVQDPRVRLVRNDENLGVGGGRNRGVRETDAPYVCFLDSDARLHPDTLARLVAPLVDDDTVGVTAPVFTDQAPEASAGRAPTLGRKLARAFNRTDVYARSPGQGVVDRCEVDFAIGACQVFRRAAFDVVGGLDDSAMFGPEDVDFCLRIREAGFRVLQVAGAICDHPPRRAFKGLATARGLRHGSAVLRHLWRHRRAQRQVVA
jgi:GT2 family glycosyltransferase/O-antigen/teichoic acid export membrane protein